MAGIVQARIAIPYEPRPLQKVLHAALERHRFAVALCHRRFGKTVLAINHLIKSALLCERPRGRFAYLAPFRNQAKDVAWAYLKHYTRPIPGVVVNESELRIDLPNGAQIRIYGADNEDALRGIYLDGVVLDEYGKMSGTIWGEIIRPLLADREGWAFFIGTPDGKNQFYTICQTAQGEPSWFYACYRASETGVLKREELDAAREHMTVDEYAQEFECSFEASVKGAVYARELALAREQGRLTHVPYDPAVPTETAWDLGVRDATAIWWFQCMMGGAVHVIDYYENHGLALDHYAQVVAGRPYLRGPDWFPHDIQQRELLTGKSRLEFARSMGLKASVVPMLQVDEGIHAARILFARCYFDADRCAAGLEALSSYRYRLNATTHYWAEKPLHDAASHGADAFRMLAVACQQRRHVTRVDIPNPIDLEPEEAWQRRRTRVAATGGRGGYA